MKVATLNVNSIRSRDKITALANTLRYFNIDILLFQETKVDSLKLAKAIELKLDGRVFWSFGSNNSRGTGIFIGKNIDAEIVRFSHDLDGRVVYVDINADDNYRIISIYAHSREETNRKLFFKSFTEFLNTNRTVILAGDFNCIENTQLDKIGGNPNKGTSGSVELKEALNSKKLKDVFRFLHPTTINTTWKNNEVACRLDRIYLEKCRINDVVRVSNHPSFSDHEIVIMDIKEIDSNSRRGKGYWKFPNSLLDDEDFCHDVKFRIVDCRREPEDEEIAEWWDDTKSTIKEVGIEWGRNRRALLDMQYRDLCREYREAERNFNVIEMTRIKLLIDDIELEKSKGAQIRARALILDETEAPSSYFYRKEISQGKKKTIQEIEVNGTKTNRQPEIVSAFQNYYEDLYSARDVDTLAEDFVKDVPQVSLEHQEALEHSITLEEIKAALEGMENNKSPGPDGLTKELYAKFFDTLGPWLVKVIQYIFDRTELTDTMKLSYITLICKNEDAPHLCKNYRPISLLNVDYKIITKVLSNRLRNVMPSIIHSDQTCSVKDRSIQDNNHYLRDIINEMNAENLSGGLVLSLDQEKAFDRIDHRYLLNLMLKFGFGPKFCRWISILYNDIQSSVIVNQHISEPFKVTRSVRQGCPLSPLLYVLALEPTLINIRADKRISGCPIPGRSVNPPKLTAFADDCKFVIISDLSVSAIFEHFDNYSKFSGSKVNKDKTELMFIGIWRNRTDTPLNIKRVEYMNIFGITFGSKNARDNWDPVVENILQRMNLFSSRKLSLPAKAKVINVMILAKAWYMAAIIPPPRTVQLIITRNIFNFLWSGKSETINRNTMYLPLEEGGVGILNIKYKYMSMLLFQILKLIKNSEASWTNFGHMYLGLSLRRFSNYTFDNCNYPHRIPTEPGFYQECVKALNIITRAKPDFELKTSLTSKDLYKLLLKSNDFTMTCQRKYPEVNFKFLFQTLKGSMIDMYAFNTTFKCIHSVLAVSNTLFRFGINVSPFCKFCPFCPETIEHILLHCNINHLARHYVKYVCFAVFDHEISDQDLRYGLSKNTKFLKQITYLISEYRLAVWSCRNKWIFENKKQGIRDSLHFLKNRFRNRVSADKKRMTPAKFDKVWSNIGLVNFNRHGEAEHSIFH